MSPGRLRGVPRADRGDALTPRQRQRLETHERLFEAALEEFGTAGFTGAQVDRIVDRAGVSRGTFYFHFPTKEHVLLELQRRGEADIVERLRSSGTYPESVADFLRVVYRTIVGSLDVDDQMRRDLMAMYIRRPMQIELANEPLIVEIVDYFEEAAERGAVRNDVPAEELAQRFLASFFTLLTIPAQDAQGEDARDAFETSIELFLNGATGRR